MRTLAFPIHMIPEATGGYSVTCPVLPGCHSQGDTLEEANANIREAIELVLKDMAAQGEPWPDPNETLAATVLVDV